MNKNNVNNDNVNDNNVINSNVNNNNNVKNKDVNNNNVDAINTVFIVSCTVKGADIFNKSSSTAVSTRGSITTPSL